MPTAIAHAHDFLAIKKTKQRDQSCQKLSKARHKWGWWNFTSVLIAPMPYCFSLGLSKLFCLYFTPMCMCRVWQGLCYWLFLKILSCQIAINNSPPATWVLLNISKKKMLSIKIWDWFKATWHFKRKYTMFRHIVIFIRGWIIQYGHWSIPL